MTIIVMMMMMLMSMMMAMMMMLLRMMAVAMVMMRRMVIAVVIAVGFMMVFANAIGRFITEHPTLKMLALSFLVLVGTALIADGLEFHIPKGYIYFAMAFSFGVEMLNLRIRANRKKAAG